MKILVLSDLHNKKGIVARLVSRQKPDYIFFLGDGISTFREETIKFPQENIFAVRGNSDIKRHEQTTLAVTLENVKFLLTHGHGFHVRNGLMELFDYAKRENIDVVCFGHTHKRFQESINGISFFNPGTVASSRSTENTFGLIEIEDGKITQKIEKI